MTTKQNPYELDAFSCIRHAAEEGVSIKEYTKRVSDYAEKRTRMISKGVYPL